MKTVMITEDDPGLQDALGLIFRRAGYEVIVLDNGDSLLNGSAPLPDIYILDRQLSGVDGLDICRFLKAQPLTSDLPVIMVSATPRIAQLAKDACADGFLEKPFEKRALLQMVESLLA